MQGSSGVTSSDPGAGGGRHHWWHRLLRVARKPAHAAGTAVAAGTAAAGARALLHVVMCSAFWYLCGGWFRRWGRWVGVGSLRPLLWSGECSSRQGQDGSAVACAFWTSTPSVPAGCVVLFDEKLAILHLPVLAASACNTVPHVPPMPAHNITKQRHACSCAPDQPMHCRKELTLCFWGMQARRRPRARQRPRRRRTPCAPRWTRAMVAAGRCTLPRASAIHPPNLPRRLAWSLWSVLSADGSICAVACMLHGGHWVSCLVIKLAFVARRFWPSRVTGNHWS